MKCSKVHALAWNQGLRVLSSTCFSLHRAWCFWVCVSLAQQKMHCHMLVLYIGFQHGSTSYWTAEFQPEIQECTGSHGLWWHAAAYTEFGHPRGFPDVDHVEPPRTIPHPFCQSRSLGSRQVRIRMGLVLHMFFVFLVCPRIESFSGCWWMNSSWSVFLRSLPKSEHSMFQLWQVMPWHIAIFSEDSAQVPRRGLPGRLP